MPSNDREDVDRQLDEAQANNDAQHPLIKNHRNNTRAAAAEENAVAGAFGVVAGPETTVTDPSANAKDEDE
ncbi:MAG TPA: hypothetical protein VFN49_09480 [Candidatus Aquilonibacter sp.]|nr:hypothetical protein [Candidatus Aquilonibacter sp.]